MENSKPHPNQIMGATLCPDNTLVFAYPVYRENKPNPDWLVDECDADYDDMALALTEAHSHGVWLAIIDPPPTNPAKAEIPKHTRKMFYEILSFVGIHGLKTPPEDWLKSVIAVNGELPKSRSKRREEMTAAAIKILKAQTQNPFFGFTNPFKNPAKAAAVCMSVFGQFIAKNQFDDLQNRPKNGKLVPLVTT